MQKNTLKTESVAEFLARGGKIKKVNPQGPKKTRQRNSKETQIEDVDMSALPAALKIKYGVR